MNRELALPTRSGYLIREIQRLKAVVQKNNRGAGTVQD